MSLAPKKLRLSKGLLQMKFMQRSKVKQMEDEAAEEGRTMYESDITEGMKAGEDKFVIENSYVPLEGLIEGRFSYGGMSPHIERLMAIEEEEVRNKSVSNGTIAEIDAEIPAEEVLNTFLANSIGRKFKSKKERSKGEIRKSKYSGMQKPREDID